MKKTVLTLIVVFFAYVTIAQNIVYVKHDATGLNDGTSWANAYVDLQNALNNVSTNDQVWVSQGNYTPDPSNRNISFAWDKDSISLYGGFVGTETAISQRSYDARTILSGNIGDSIDQEDNSYTVISGPLGGAQEIINYAYIDGFKITRGNANSGGFVSTRRFGAGFYYNVNVREVSMYNCEITENGALSGAAVSFRPGTNDATLRLTNCKIHKNFASASPAIEARGFTGFDVTLRINNCLINDNTIADYLGNKGTSGSALYFGGQDGGGCDVEILNSTIADNNNNGTGVAADRKFTIMFYNKNGAEQTKINMLNTIVWGNDDDISLFGPNPSVGGTPQPFTSIFTKDCILQDTLAVPGVTRRDVKIVDPEFQLTNDTINPYSIKGTSPAREIGRSSNTVSVDVVGNSRVSGSLDIGCYEFQRTANIQHIERNILSVYPNPANSRISIASTNPNTEVKIYNALGAEVLTSAQSQNINISALPVGIYTLLAEQNGSMHHAKFIKK